MNECLFVINLQKVSVKNFLKESSFSVVSCPKFPPIDKEPIACLLSHWTHLLGSYCLLYGTELVTVGKHR